MTKVILSTASGMILGAILSTMSPLAMFIFLGGLSMAVGALFWEAEKWD